MRFNELLAGVRGDIAVKVFGEEFEPMLRAANEIAAILRGTGGRRGRARRAGDGLPFLEIKVDKKEIARRGLSLAVVQDLIGAAVGGARPAWSSRATGASKSSSGCRKSQRDRSRGAAQPSGAAAGRQRARADGDHSAQGGRRVHRRAKGRTRSAAKTASGASSSPPMCAVATSRRWSRKRRRGSPSRSGCRPATGSHGAGSSRI